MPAYYACLPTLYCNQHPCCGPIRQQNRNEFSGHRMNLDICSVSSNNSSSDSGNITYSIPMIPMIDMTVCDLEASPLAPVTPKVTPELAPVLKIYVDNHRYPIRMEYM